MAGSAGRRLCRSQIRDESTSTAASSPRNDFPHRSKECRDRAVAEHEGVCRANEARASVSEAEVAAFGETLIFGGLAPRIAGSTAPKGSKVFAFMLKKTS